MLSHETSPLRDPNDFTFIDPANGQRLAYPGNTDLWKWTNIPGFNCLSDRHCWRRYR